MDDDAPGFPSFATTERVGDQLRAVREKAGLTLAEVAARTRVPQRHLEAIETGRYSDLPSPTYANGFAKAYARAVDLDEVDIGRRLRGEMASIARPAPVYQPIEATDPTRVPSRGLTVVALGVAVAVLILAGLYFGTTLFRGDGAGSPTPTVANAPPAAAPVAPQPVPTAMVPADGQVTLTATEEVWVRLYDADGKTLHQGTLKAGESFDVPADASDPMVNVGRPDHLRFTVNGAAVQGLDLGSDPIKDVRISAAALAARVAPPAPGATPTPVVQNTATDRPRGDARPVERRRAAPVGRADRPRRTGDGLTDTQRANLEAARPPAATGNAQ